MTSQNTVMQKNEQIRALEDGGFQYAAIYLADPVLFENLTVNDLSVLRYASLYGKDTEDGLAVRGRRFGRDELEEMAVQAIPTAVHSYLQSRNVSRGPSAEEIFIIDDIYRSQNEGNLSDRFDQHTLDTLRRGSRIHFFKHPFTPAHAFIELVTGSYLFMPLPKGLKAPLFLADIMKAVEKTEGTPELEEYVQKVLRKTADFHVALETQYIGIRLSDAYLKMRSADEVRKLQEQLGFGLKGYKPIKDVDAINMFHRYGQVIKDGILGIRDIQSCYGIGRKTEFGRWISEEWSKVAEQITRDNPLLNR